MSEATQQLFNPADKVRHIGSKIIDAVPMTLGDYNQYRGWSIPEGEDPGKPGYLVEYLDGGEPNDERHEGYISWSPADVFNMAYRPTAGMSFSAAIEAVKIGCRVAREGWNGRDMFIFLVPGSHFQVNRPPLLGIYPEGTAIDYRPHIDMRTADGEIVPWVASQSDLLCDDWSVVG